MMKLSRHSLVFVLCSLAFATAARSQTDAAAPLAAGDSVAMADPAAVPRPSQGATQTSAQLEQLLAPIALYPDELVAQVLAASTYPAEVVQASRWIQQHPGLQGQELGGQVDSQSWDASVKALTQFPSVLNNMNENLDWTSSLGDAYLSQPQDVLATVQTLRQRAKTAGSLQSTGQQTVTVQDQAIAIEPADPQVVYVPAYDPWLVYGPPLLAYPGWVDVAGVYGTNLYFGVGFGIGLYAGFGWGWHDWGFDWRNRHVVYRHAPYVSHARSYASRREFNQRPVRFEHSAPAIRERAGVQGAFERREIGQGYALRERPPLGEVREGFLRGGERGGAFRGGELREGGERR